MGNTTLFLSPSPLLTHSHIQTQIPATPHTPTPPKTIQIPYFLFPFSTLHFFPHLVFKFNTSFCPLFPRSFTSPIICEGLTCSDPLDEAYYAFAIVLVSFVVWRPGRENHVPGLLIKNPETHSLLQQPPLALLRSFPSGRGGEPGAGQCPGLYSRSSGPAHGTGLASPTRRASSWGHRG